MAVSTTRWNMGTFSAIQLTEIDMEKDQTPKPISFKGVMVSSTFTDLEEHRAALIKAIKAHGFTDIAMENDSAKPDVDVIESSLQMIRDASAYVGVISHKYGQTPVCPIRNRQQLSITELEFNEALRLGRPILLFIMGEDHPTKKSDFEIDPIKSKKLDAFRQQAKQMGSKSTVHRVYATFQTLEQFKEQIHISLAKLHKHLDKQPHREQSSDPISVNSDTTPTPPVWENRPEDSSLRARANCGNSVPNDGFACKVRGKIKDILSTGEPAASALCEALLKGQPLGVAPEDVLIPKNNPVLPEPSIRALRKAVLACLQPTQTHAADIKQRASKIMGWLILLCVDAEHAIDIDNVNEIVVPYTTSAGIEVFVARLEQRPASLLIKGSDKVHGYGHVELADLELGFTTPDCLQQIKKAVYNEVFKKDPVLGDDWLAKLKKMLELHAEDDRKLYYFSLPIARRSELTETITQLKACLPKLQILITGACEDGSQSIAIMAEGELEALIIHFLSALA